MDSLSGDGVKSEAIFLNEVEKVELEWLLEENDGELSQHYCHHFVAFPEEMWSAGFGESAEWGVAILWRADFLTEVHCGKHELFYPAPPLAF